MGVAMSESVVSESVVSESERREARRKHLCDEAYRFGVEYHRVYSKPAPMKFYAARYGKAFRAIGLALRDGLESDGRFRVKLRGGGHDVTVVGTSDHERRILARVMSTPEGVTWDMLASDFKGLWVKAGELQDMLMNLTDAGLIDLRDRRYFAGTD